MKSHQLLAENKVPSTMNVRAPSEILGHTKVVLTLQLYAHSSMETKQKELAKMDAFLWFSRVFRYQLRYELRYVAKGVPHFAGFTGRDLRIFNDTTKKDSHFCKSWVEHSGFEPLTPTLPVGLGTPFGVPSRPGNEKFLHYMRRKLTRGILMILYGIFWAFAACVVVRKLVKTLVLEKFCGWGGSWPINVG